MGSSWLKTTVDKVAERVGHKTPCCQALRGSEGRKQWLGALQTAWHPFPGFVEGHVGRGEGELLHLSFHCLSESALALNFLILGHTGPESRFYLLAAGT